MLVPTTGLGLRMNTHPRITEVVRLTVKVHGIKFQIPATHYPDMKSMCERLSKACLRKQQLIPLLRTNIGFFERRLTHGWSGNKQKRIILKANYASSGVGSERVILDIHLP